MWLISFNNTIYMSWSINRRELYILVLEQYLRLDPRPESTTLSTTVLIIILSTHHLS